MILLSKIYLSYAGYSVAWNVISYKICRWLHS